MVLHELFPALIPVLTSFDKLGIAYYIGGSFSSSIHGIPRTTMDIDIVADIKRSHVDHFYQYLQNDYYIDKDMICSALEKKSSFNIIHLGTMMKIDVFVLKDRDFDRQAFNRREPGVLDEGNRRIEYYLSSPEDIILSKLEWFKMGGGVSERQWKDVIGVLKVQGDNLDTGYLQEWAKELKLSDLLEELLKGTNQE
ncbi:MAG: hypothetical protein KAW12_05765 [Candidatus Aminicenantes bacterium]|nr:hypothetical protein [Candidatus Aminicenantes bacterium]